MTITSAAPLWKSSTDAVFADTDDATVATLLAARLSHDMRWA